MSKECCGGPKVDFSYAFAPPHRLTVALPDSSDKTLLDLEPGKLKVSWTYENLTRLPIAAYMVPPTTWQVGVIPEIEGQPFARSVWTRAGGWLPILVNSYEDARGSVRLEASGGKTAAVIHARITNTDEKAHRFTLWCETAAIWGRGFNPGWVDLDGPDVLLAGWRDRGDKVLLLGLGAEEFPVLKSNTLCLAWDLKPGETREGWLVRPYRACAADLPSLRAHNWAGEMSEAHEVWTKLIGRASPVLLTDPAVENALHASLADLFIMREPVADGYIAGLSGTEVYRFTSPGEPGMASVAMDQFGLHDEAERGYRVFLDHQKWPSDGADVRDAFNLMWFYSGFRAWTAMEHYRLTRDHAYLKRIYPRLATASRWQEKQRAKTRIVVQRKRSSTYGLMPRGVGDCGLMDGDDYFGVFIPHNIWAVYADRCSVDAAEILGRTADLPELRQIHQTALKDLLVAMEEGAVEEGGYRWIPAVPGKKCASRWGVLNAVRPCKTLPPDHDLISDTIRHMESHLSPGGLPVDLGWLADGIWLSVALDNLAEAHLARGNGDAAAKYLYASLNHASPLFTWVEERGQEPNASKTTGDRQQLWTPTAVVRLIRDCLVMEDEKGLHLARGTARHWLASGKPMGISSAPTYFGPVSFQLQYDAASASVKGKVMFPVQPSAEWAVLYIRLTEGLRVVSVDSASDAVVMSDGSGIRWQCPCGTSEFQVRMRPGK